MAKYPSFKAQHGRAPIAGQDYDPDATWCQDDYEYYTGTGRYSDDVPADEFHQDLAEEAALKSLRYGF